MTTPPLSDGGTVERGAGPRIVIVGAGLGGLALAVALRRYGHAPRVVEQADRFARVGAGINVGPNATKALRGLGLEPALLKTAHLPEVWENRVSDTGETIRDIPLGEEAEGRYGARFLQMHRADLHAALVEAVDPAALELGRRLVGTTDENGEIELRFADGTTTTADVVIGADGIHSRVRHILFGDQPLHFTGRVAYRGIIPAEDLVGVEMAPFAKWWGPDRHIVIYYATSAGDVYYVTSVPEQDWHTESWSAEGDPDELRGWFADFHPEVRGILDRCRTTYKWALYDREPMDLWHRGRIGLLGDAVHPMTPYLAQGAAMAIEDAVVLARLIDRDGLDDPDATFGRFYALRHPRTTHVQEQSRANRFGRDHGDTAALYGYDAWTTPLDQRAQEIA